MARTIRCTEAQRTLDLEVDRNCDFVARAETEVGPIDILLNNSGVSTTQRLQDVTPEDYDYIFDTNVKGSFFVAQEVGKRMLARAVP